MSTTTIQNSKSKIQNSLERVLRERVEGEVRFEDGDRALYATDASNYRQVPIGVVIPHNREDVIATIRTCRDFDLPVLMRGGGTSLAGQCCNDAVVLDTSKYFNRVLEIDPERQIARVEPGVRLDDLRDAAAEHGLTFGPDPATHRWCTLGGMIGNNSCGVHSVMARLRGPGARTEHQVEELEVLTYRGDVLRVGATSDDELDRTLASGEPEAEIYGNLRDLRDRYADQIRECFPQIPRRVSGFNLDELLPENGFHVARALVGSESTCVTILEATVRLIPNPAFRTLLVASYPSVYDAGAHVPDFLETKPLALEGMDDLLVEFLHKSHLQEAAIKELLRDAGGWLLVEYGGDTQEEATRWAREAMETIRSGANPPEMDFYEDPEVQTELWEIRESGLAATAWVPGEDDTWPGWEDSAVPPENLGPYLRDLRSLFQKYDYRAALYGHFGDGCIHCRISFPLRTEEGLSEYRSFLNDATDLVLEYGGSLSGEHGDGQARGALLDRMYGPDVVQAFREFKAIWDPDCKMNPGKVIDPDPPTSYLRLGPQVDLPEVETHFRFPNDEGSFVRAAERCVGVGKCRKTDGGTMCPSYMVLEEEKHTTRGRAHLLFEMLVGDPVSKGWGDQAVKESLDLCLSCKGCKHECPVDVDVATYRAEFMSHYFEDHRRPLSAYAFGYIDVWARLASLMPDLANLATHLPGLSAIAKRIVGIAPQRRIPEFAPRTFRQWWDSRESSQNHGGTRVILWPDTFNNHFHPATAAAAVEVLEDAGCSVTIPRAGLCCGRPLYEFGLLDRAKRLLREIVDELRDEIRDGVPVIAMEPSCATVFRDELRELFPDDQDACRLADQVLMLDEFLVDHLDDYEVPNLDLRAIVHGHCHQKAIIGMDAHQRLMERMGLDAALLDSGCCGMAGAFGFEKEKYDVSIGAGERVLLPAVRGADEDELVITSGFSCREQIQQQTGRRAMHVAEVVRMGVAARGEARLPAASTAGGTRALTRTSGAIENRTAALDGLRRGTSPLLGAAAALGAGVLGLGVVAGVRRLL